MNSNSTVAVVVEMGGTQVVAHVGLHLLGSFADRLGLGDSLSAAIAPSGERLPVHDRGKVLTQAMLMLAGGGEACADIEHLRAQPDLFGAVPSDSTLYRTFRDIDAAHARPGCGTRSARCARRCVAADRRRRPARRTVVLDIDSSLHRGALGEQGRDGAELQGRVRVPSDLLLRRCHRRVRSPSCCGRATRGRTRSPITSPCWTRRSPSCPPRSPSVTVTVTTRTWCAGRCRCAPTRPGAPISCGAAGNATSASPSIARTNSQVHAAISRMRSATKRRWQQASRQDGDERPGAAVAELTDLVDLADWPAGTRLIVRREPLHPGAQRLAVPVAAVPLLGALHRRRRRPRRPRRAHARPRPRRRQHQTTEGLRRRPVPVRRHRRQPGLARRRLLWPTPSCAGSNCSA